MNFQPKTWFYCTPGGWLFSGSNTNRSKPPMRTKPYTVLQPIPGHNPKPLFTVHAYSLAQARAIVAAKTIVVALAQTSLVLEPTR
jgi:hypothetical protein